MLPTILESENSSFHKDSYYANSRAPQKTDPDVSTSHQISSYKTIQARSDHVSDQSRGGQSQKRGTSPYAHVGFYPIIRTSVLAQNKTKPLKNSDSVRESPPIIKKKSSEHLGEHTLKRYKPVASMAHTNPDEPESNSYRKSLPASTVSQQKQGPHSNSKIVREVLKAKFKGREYPIDNTISGSTQHHLPASEKSGKARSIHTDGLLYKVSHESLLLNEKSPTNGQIQDNYQRYLNQDNKGKGNQEHKSISHVSGDRTLLHSTSKRMQKDNNVNSYISTETDEIGVIEPYSVLKDGQLMMNGAKKTPNHSPLSKGKEHTYSPIIRLLLHKAESASAKTEKEKERSPSVGIKYKRSQRDVLSISPTKKGKSILEKQPSKEIKNDARALEIKKAAAPVPIILSEEEKAIYGNRCPPDYDKKELLGKGGFALVWLGVCKRTGRKVALKQMSKSGGGGSESSKNDLYYGQLLFKEGGESRDEFKQYPGIANVACFIDYKSTKSDEWHVSELCGKPLSSLLFDMKGEFYKGERVYGIKHLELYHQFRQDPYLFKMFIKDMAEAIDLFSNYYIVHSDIKPENILITMNSGAQEKPFQLKIIDFGSAYNWGDTGNVKMATPEYMPPEFLNALMGRSGGENTIEQLAEMSRPWSVDVWSLGSVLLEVITGIPLWIPLKCKVDSGGKKPLRYGLFAVKGRAYDKIYQKQKALVENLAQSIGEYLENWGDAQNLYDLLVNMLRWDPKKRISPSSILQHPYLKTR